MEEKPKVIFKETARIALRQISCFIETKGYPETAENFANKLFEFGHSLADFPGAYSVCKQKRLALKKCIAPFFTEAIFSFISW